MKLTVIGKEKVDYVSKKTNKPVTGINLHCTGENDKVSGKAVEKVYISALSPMYQQCLDTPLNSVVLVSYNRWGSIETVTPVSAK